MKLKTIIGFALIILSIAGMIFWESCGREAIVCTEILTASRDISEGEIISEGDIAVSSVDKKYVMPSALPASDFYNLSGLRVSSSLKQGQQLAMDHFSSAPILINEGESIFVIPDTWIFTMSCTIDLAEHCDVYLMPDEKLIGSYVLAERENNIEIVCTPAEYFKIFDLMNREEISSLMLVPSNPEWRIPE